MSEQPESIRILHVDDEPDFAELAAVYLQQEEEQFEIETVMSPQKGLARLSETTFDCIISDHDMPRQNGIEFLEEIREEYPKLPFILFTGKGSEAVASDAISAGVTDYMQKETGTDQYIVLANQIRNIVEKRRAEQAAKQIRTRFEAITENSKDAILTIDSEYIIQFANHAAEELFGYTPDRLAGESLTTLLPTRHHDSGSNKLEKYLQPAEPTRDWTAVEFSGQHQDGHEVPVSVSFGRFEESGEQRFVGVFRDISNRVRMEEELREREERFRQLAENIQEMVWMTDPRRGEVIYVNPVYEDIWGQSADGLYENPQSYADAIHPADRGRVEAKLDPETAGGYEEEYRIVRPDGEVRWIYDRAVPIRDDAGDVYRTVGIASDITERKQREEEYDQTLELLDHTEQIADVGGWEIDPETEAVFWSENLFKLLGWESNEEPPLEDALGVYVEADRPRIERVVENALSDGKSFAVEAQFQRPDGDVRWAEIRGDPQLENGEVVTLRGAVHDITGRIRREHVLREMYEITSDRHTSFDEKVRSLLKLGRRELDTEYGTLSKVQGDDYVFEFVDADDNSIKEGDIVPVSTTNCELVANNKQTVVFGDVERDAPEETNRKGFTDWGISCYIGAPVFTGDNVRGTFCFYDTTARTNQFSDWEETLIDLMSNWVSAALQQKQATTELQTQNEQLDEFVRVVSHDLRNPLNVVEGRLELAQRECDSDHLDSIDQAVSRMGSLIDNLLVLARTGQQVNELETVDLNDIAASCWQNVATGDATLKINVEQSIQADSSRLQQLFENLLRNAIEHSGNNVSVTIGELDDGFYVEDTGPGIPTDKRETVFDTGYSTRQDGTGFGLSIVKRIAQAHGWSIAATAGAEGGARFEITGFASQTS